MIHRGGLSYHRTFLVLAIIILSMVDLISYAVQQAPPQALQMMVAQ